MKQFAIIHSKKTLKSPFQKLFFFVCFTKLFMLVFSFVKIENLNNAYDLSVCYSYGVTFSTNVLTSKIS